MAVAAPGPIQAAWLQLGLLLTVWRAPKDALRREQAREQMQAEPQSHSLVQLADAAGC